MCLRLDLREGKRYGIWVAIWGERVDPGSPGIAKAQQFRDLVKGFSCSVVHSVTHVAIEPPLVAALRQRVVPPQWSESIKELWRARIDLPHMTSELKARLRDIFDADLAQLGAWLGIQLDCENFHETTLGRAWDWIEC